MAPDGGTLATTWTADINKYSDTTVQPFDDAREQARSLAGTTSHVEFRIAMERLTIARNQAYEAAG
jgi:hypothetical protein